MLTTTTEMLPAILEHWKSVNLDQKLLAQQEQAINMFEELKKRGLITSRGNCLQDVTERYRRVPNSYL